LATDLDEMYWNDPRGCSVVYEEYDEPRGIWGGMGGGVVTDRLWLHPDFEPVGIEGRVLEVIEGRRPRAGITVFDALRYSKDDEQARTMASRLRGQFPFLGLDADQRKRRSAPYFKSFKKDGLDWGFVLKCWEQPEREFQYLAVDYLSRQKGNLGAADIPALRELAVRKPWWDTADRLAAIVGSVAARFPESNGTLLDWSRDGDRWLRRIAICHQLGRKERTDTGLLERVIANNLGQRDRVIESAIRRALRDYGKTNPEWVRSFLDRHELEKI
jgi:3-methyladenine DNA glycosylase AlkD